MRGESTSSWRSWIESVTEDCETLTTAVDLLLEVVNWKAISTKISSTVSPSTSSWRSWIERHLCYHYGTCTVVDLLLEVVNWKDQISFPFNWDFMSTSSWRSWIERMLRPTVGVRILRRPPLGGRELKGSYDMTDEEKAARRPPLGGRELKGYTRDTGRRIERSISSWRSWIERDIGVRSPNTIRGTKVPAQR